MPYIVSTEDPATSSTAECVNCGQIQPGRMVDTLDWLHRRSRGWYFLCYQCFGPRIFWRKRSGGGQVYESPVNITLC